MMDRPDVLIIGGGPAGLMAADCLTAQGRRVVLAEAKPTVARKFLMAGKSGLNLTKDEEFGPFLSAYGSDAKDLEPMLTAFGPKDVWDWAENLGQTLFAGSSGRVFPEVMKASPLLRAWLGRLDQQGLDLRTGWRWCKWGDGFHFETSQGPQVVHPKACILACGGASWARLGSDGAWAQVVPAQHLTPFEGSNLGFLVDWSAHMAPVFGHPLKNIRLSAGDLSVRAECVISKDGLEGGGIYAVSRALRAGAALTLDLLPDLTQQEIAAKLKKQPKKQSLSNRLRKALRLDPAKMALLMEFGRPLPEDPASVIKALPVRLSGPRPMDQAISTSGGVRFDALTADLMFRDRPGVFAAGEMLDWDAPTGGYLLTACLATGLWAGQGADRFLGGL